MSLPVWKSRKIARRCFVLPFFIAAFIADAATSGNADSFDQAKALIGRYGCGACHDIPGISGADGRVGPPLGGMANRVFIAGKLQNNRENMSKWISDPQSIVPGNAMPSMGISRGDAEQIATYLETLTGPGREQ